MMAQVRKHKFKAIVVYRLDRISRNISDFTGLIDELNKLDVSFVSIREQFNTSTPMGRAMMFIISVFSQLERETIAERNTLKPYVLKQDGYQIGYLAAESLYNQFWGDTRPITQKLPVTIIEFS